MTIDEVTPLSRIELILYAYDFGLSYDEKPRSRIEAIVLNLLFGTNYILKSPRSRIEEQLMALEGYDGNILSRIEKILNVKINGGEYDYELLSRVEVLLMGGKGERKWKYLPIDDNFGNHILDNNGEIIYGRIKVAA